MRNLKTLKATIASAAAVAIVPANATVVEISGSAQAFGTELESDFFERSSPLAPGDDLDIFGSVRENSAGVSAGSEVIADLAAGTFRLFTTAQILDISQPAPFGPPADARARVAFETTFIADGNGQVQFLANINGDIDFASGSPNAGAGRTFTLQNALGQIIAEQFYSYSDQPDPTIFLSTIVEPGEGLTLLFDFSMFASANQTGERVVNDFGNTISFAVLTMTASPCGATEAASSRTCSCPAAPRYRCPPPPGSSHPPCSLFGQPAAGGADARRADLTRTASDRTRRVRRPTDRAVGGSPAALAVRSGMRTWQAEAP